MFKLEFIYKFIINQLYGKNQQTVLYGFDVICNKEGKVDLKYSDEFLLIYFQALVEGISSLHIYSKVLPYTTQWTELLIKGIAT
jgi:hypothetical protein